MSIKDAYPQSHYRRTRPIFKDEKTGEMFSHMLYYEKAGKADVEKVSERASHPHP